MIACWDRFTWYQVSKGFEAQAHGFDQKASQSCKCNCIPISLEPSFICADQLYSVWIYGSFDGGFYFPKLQKREAPSGEKPEPVRTHLRNMIIVPEMIGSVIGVYNGKTFNQVEIKVCGIVKHYPWSWLPLMAMKHVDSIHRTQHGTFSIRGTTLSRSNCVTNWDGLCCHLITGCLLWIVYIWICIQLSIRL
jgi:hypothetical protein